LVRYRPIEPCFAVHRNYPVTEHALGLVPALLDSGEIVDNDPGDHPSIAAFATNRTFGAGCSPNNFSQ
jgi:hypothetical protein